MKTFSNVLRAFVSFFRTGFHNYFFLEVVIDKTWCIIFETRILPAVPNLLRKRT